MPRLLTLLLCTALAGCQIVHKQSIQQGNVIDEDDLSRLEVGLTKRQVQVLLGSPAITDPFHSDRWDYVNTYAPRGGKLQRRWLTVEFEDGVVKRFYGSYLDDQPITGEDPRDLKIIDPNTNQPVLPPEDPTRKQPPALPSPERPSGGSGGNGGA